MITHESQLNNESGHWGVGTSGAHTQPRAGGHYRARISPQTAGVLCVCAAEGKATVTFVHKSQ